ncbi:MAG: patatin-like phospholipase family protein [Hyphomicrobiaceae bacterium]|nr:patatin-like phospholipase family protein [Hyphomicrobiaceae bacterium]MCC0023669.1 patatin-like phospholipase family protein [Hyphomicrobiaceae bacterium]
MHKPKIGLALGGGAARGWAHIGVIETLREAGIVPDIICGTSIGALIGGVHAAGKLDKLKDWALRADWIRVISMVDVSILGGGLVEGGRIVKWLIDFGLKDSIENLDIPFGAVATDLTTGREIWLEQGPLGPAIRASIALPGLFSPIKLDERWLVDGGLVNPVPVSLCRAMGAEFIIAVPLNENVLGRPLTPVIETQKPAEPAPASNNLLDLIRDLPNSVGNQIANINLFMAENASPGYFDVLTNSINIMQDHITRSRLATDPPDVEIRPRIGEIGLLDFHRGQEVIDLGRRAAELAVPQIMNRMKEAQSG